MSRYGAAPTERGVWDLEFVEYMHYMYLPIRVPEVPHMAIPERLKFAETMIFAAINTELREHSRQWSHIYVTARRGYATPGNPLNRPGWHADGFGTDDVNYVWTDRFPTDFAVQEFTGISDDHAISTRQFEEQIDPARVRRYPDRMLLRLDDSVIHAAPAIPEPGGERSFFKISFSESRYDLIGNSRNHRLNYSWPMYTREEIRNDPSRSGGDSGSVRRGS